MKLFQRHQMQVLRVFSCLAEIFAKTTPILQSQVIAGLRVTCTWNEDETGFLASNGLALSNRVEWDWYDHDTTLMIHSITMS
jgi:hypothetical protein